jgi:hypothetical protein
VHRGGDERRRRFGGFVDDYRNSLIVGRGSFVDRLRTEETRRAILFEEQAVQALVRLATSHTTPAATSPFSTRLGAFRRRGVEKPLSRLVACYLRKTTAMLSDARFAANLGGQRAQGIDAAAFGDVDDCHERERARRRFERLNSDFNEELAPILAAAAQHTTRPVPSGCTIGFVRNKAPGHFMDGTVIPTVKGVPGILVYNLLKNTSNIQSVFSIFWAEK